MKKTQDTFAREKLNLLIRNDRFVNLIEKMRVDFNIPQDGFTTKNDMAKWNEDIIKQCKSKKEIETKIQYSITIPTKLETVLKKIMCQFKLTNFYANPLIGFILYNKLDVSPFSIKNSNIGISMDYDYKSYPQYKINIEVYPETTPDDFTLSLPLIMKIKRHVNRINGIKNNSRNTPLKNPDIYYKIFDLAKSGKSNVEIKDVIKDEIKKLSPKRVIGYNDIAIKLKRIRDRIKKL